MNGPGKTGSPSPAFNGDGGRADTELLQAFLVPELQVACPSPTPETAARIATASLQQTGRHVLLDGHREPWPRSVRPSRSTLRWRTADPAAMSIGGCPSARCFASTVAWNAAVSGGV